MCTSLGDLISRLMLATAGGSLSLQKHLRRSEHWIVVRGTALVTLDDTRKMIHENESIYVPIGITHRLENPGEVPLILIEVRTGSYLGEDDTIRFEGGAGES
jgi:mannose-6-phosphate isomerase-like protein (cupin superfamily)